MIVPAPAFPSDLAAYGDWLASRLTEAGQRVYLLRGAPAEQFDAMWALYQRWATRAATFADIQRGYIDPDTRRLLMSSPAYHSRTVPLLFETVCPDKPSTTFLATPQGRATLAQRIEMALRHDRPPLVRQLYTQLLTPCPPLGLPETDDDAVGLTKHMAFLQGVHPEEIVYAIEQVGRLVYVKPKEIMQAYFGAGMLPACAGMPTGQQITVLALLLARGEFSPAQAGAGLWDIVHAFEEPPPAAAEYVARLRQQVQYRTQGEVILEDFLYARDSMNVLGLTWETVLPGLSLTGQLAARCLWDSRQDDWIDVLECYEDAEQQWEDNQALA